MSPHVSPSPVVSLWTRRRWLAQTALPALWAMPLARLRSHRPAEHPMPVVGGGARVRQLTYDEDFAALANYAVDAAKSAGARYADARLTRTIQQSYTFGDDGADDIEEVGVGVRALVDGYWGFSASPSGDREAVEQLARQAVAQARVNARGAVPRSVDLGTIKAPVGHWSTPVTLDPFTVPIEEKHAMMRYWVECASDLGLEVEVQQSELHFIRQERVVATSEGGHFTQAVIESGGKILIQPNGQSISFNTSMQLPITGIASAGRGWELFVDAKIPEQIQAMPEQFVALDALQKGAGVRPATVGRYTLVCDGATMAALVSATLGEATQIDRALGYEANSRGTSFLDDPFAMLGTFAVAAPHVTVTANRSAEAQLATVQWDDEGVEPRDFTLVKDGVLVDFQTNREQSAWLQPYYSKAGRPIHSNGCAASENALGISMQHTPNLALEPGPASVHMDDLIANVQDGLLLTEGSIMQIDFQARNGLLFSPQLRRIQNGRAGAFLTGGAIQFNSLELWRNVKSVAGPSTSTVVPFSQYPYGGEYGAMYGLPVKGEPPQLVSHSVRAAAALIVNQPLINPARKV